MRAERWRPLAAVWKLPYRCVVGCAAPGSTDRAAHGLLDPEFRPNTTEVVP
jgi:hypothetical protein